MAPFIGTPAVFEVIFSSLFDPALLRLATTIEDRNAFTNYGLQEIYGRTTTNTQSCLTPLLLDILLSVRLLGTPWRAKAAAFCEVCLHGRGNRLLLSIVEETHNYGKDYKETISLQLSSQWDPPPLLHESAAQLAESVGCSSAKLRELQIAKKPSSVLPPPPSLQHIREAITTSGRFEDTLIGGTRVGLIATSIFSHSDDELVASSPGCAVPRKFYNSCYTELELLGRERCCGQEGFFEGNDGRSFNDDEDDGFDDDFDINFDNIPPELEFRFNLPENYGPRRSKHVKHIRSVFALITLPARSQRDHFTRLQSSQTLDARDLVELDRHKESSDFGQERYHCISADVLHLGRGAEGRPSYWLKVDMRSERTGEATDEDAMDSSGMY